MKNSFHFFLFVFFFIPVFLYAQTVDSLLNPGTSVQTASGTTITFPYKINFTQAELDFIKTLDDTTMQKLLRVAIMLSQNSGVTTTNSTQNSNQATNTNNGQYYTSQTPYYNSQTGQYQSSQPVYSSQYTNSNPYISNAYGVGGMSENPAYGGMTNGFTGQGTYLSNFANGVNTGYQTSQLPPVDPNFKIPEGISENCRVNYGISAGGSCPDVEHLTSTVKIAAMKACTLIGKRIPSQSQYRSPMCNWRVGGASASSHMSGMALDINVNSLTTVERQTVFMTFKQYGFNNIGCYRAGSGNVHLDHRPGGPRRWGSTYTSSSFNAANCPAELIQVFGN